MSELGLIDVLNGISRYYDVATNRLRFPTAFFTPGAVTALAAFARSRDIAQQSLEAPQDGKVSGYLSAIGLSRALWGRDDYAYERRHEGENYSSLEHLDNPQATDIATSRINSCIRRFMSSNLPHPFVARLCEVVGDLHENVWAHGKSSGFSMAQKWRGPWWKRDDYLEFALVDCGLGFSAEMRRVGMDVESDRAAIEWCIQEGHSTKKLRPESPWVQRMPEDIIHNPLRGIEQTRVSDNHHMGLGLYKLTRLVNEFRGRLWLATGGVALYLAPDGENTYIALTHPWKGVAIACRFEFSQVKRAGVELEADKDIEEIIRVLRGAHD